jgi:hypothetical protein
MFEILILGASLIGIIIIRYFLYQCDSNSIEYTPLDNSNLEIVNEPEIPPKYEEINLVN